MKTPHTPFIAAITGGSCSGKTTIAQGVARDLGASGVLIAEDDYYLCSSTIPDFDPATTNFDLPSAKDHALLLQHLRALRAGEAIEKPLYDFATHRRKAETERVKSKNFIVVEGMHILTDPDLRAMFDVKIFMDTDEQTRRGRRMMRDMLTRGRTPDFILEQFRTHVQPMHERYVDPQMQYADILIEYDPALDVDDHVKQALTGIFKLED